MVDKCSFAPFDRHNPQWYAVNFLRPHCRYAGRTLVFLQHWQPWNIRCLRAGNNFNPWFNTDLLAIFSHQHRFLTHAFGICLKFNTIMVSYPWNSEKKIRTYKLLRRWTTMPWGYFIWMMFLLWSEPLILKTSMLRILTLSTRLLYIKIVPSVTKVSTPNLLVELSSIISQVMREVNPILQDCTQF